MSRDFFFRTAILATWLVTLFLTAPMGTRTGLLAAAVALLWAVPLLRDRVARRADTPAGH